MMPPMRGRSRLRGQIFLQRGQCAKRIPICSGQLSKSDDAAVRELLVGSLLEGKVDFATYRTLPVDFEKLLTEPEQHRPGCGCRRPVWCSWARPRPRSRRCFACRSVGLRSRAGAHRSPRSPFAAIGWFNHATCCTVVQQVPIGHEWTPRGRIAARVEAQGDAAGIRRFLDYFGQTFNARSLERNLALKIDTGEWLCNHCSAQYVDSPDARWLPPRRLGWRRS